MGYRDELEAARARVEQLEGELAEARARIAQLEAPPAVEPLPKPEPAAPPKRRSSRSLGRVHYHPPRTYLPFLSLWRASVQAAWERRPVIRELRTDSVLGWAFHYVVVLPLGIVLRLPLYYLAMAIALPWALVVCLAASVVILPLLVLSRLSFAARPPVSEIGWWHGEPTTTSGAMFLWILMSVTAAPLLAVTTSLLEESGGE